MGSVSSFVNVTWCADTVLVAALLLRLGYLRAYRRYPFLVAFLALDPVGLLIGLTTGRGSQIYYWSYMRIENLLGNILRVLMAREMFSELYEHHPGLPGITRRTLNRSILAGTVIALALGPVVLIHRGEPGFTCWYAPLFEVHRCVLFGVAVFIVWMWRKLRQLPLRAGKNVSAYAHAIGWSSVTAGVLETIVLIGHNPTTTAWCSAALMLAGLVFHTYLLVRIEEPVPTVGSHNTESTDPVLLARLQNVRDLLDKIEEATGRATSIALARKLPRAGLERLLRAKRRLEETRLGVLLFSRPDDLVHKE